MNYISDIRNIFRRLAPYRISLYAANASFYVILSVFPTIMLIMALLPVFGIGSQTLLDAMEGLVPEVLSPLIQTFLKDTENNSTGILLSTTAPIAIWSASGGIYCIRLGLNHMHMDHTPSPYSFLINRFSSILYTIILILALVLTLIVDGLGQPFIDRIANQNIPLFQFIGMILKIRAVILFGILTGTFSAMYRFFPSKDRRLSVILPGAVLGSSGWLIFTAGYSWYVRFSRSYSLLYGSLSIVAMGMAWLYICISILFYGYALNILISKEKK